MTMMKLRPQSDHAIQTQTYTTLLVHAEPGTGSSHRVKAAAALARELDAHLIGLGAEAMDVLPGADPAYISGDWVSLMQEQVENDLLAAEKGFLGDAAGADVEWRTAQDFPDLAMARAARAADLIVVSPRTQGGRARCVDPAEIVMTAGRPVLIVPDGAHLLRAKTIVIAWKDTREARRAIADALPLLHRAEAVIVQAVCREDDHDAAVFATEDVVIALKRHGVAARATVSHADGDQVVLTVTRTAELNGADLIVAGAYGHSRAREWLFGGVTFDLVHKPPCFVLTSH